MLRYLVGLASEKYFTQFICKSYYALSLFALLRYLAELVAIRTFHNTKYFANPSKFCLLITRYLAGLASEKSYLVLIAVIRYLAGLASEKSYLVLFAVMTYLAGLAFEK
jgi:hypothetical protein